VNTNENLIAIKIAANHTETNYFIQVNKVNIDDFCYFVFSTIYGEIKFFITLRASRRLADIYMSNVISELRWHIRRYTWYILIAVFTLRQMWKTSVRISNQPSSPPDVTRAFA